MLILTQTTDKIQVVLWGAITTNQLQCYASYRDMTPSSYTPWRNAINTNNTTDVDLVWAPWSSTQRGVDFISVYNSDTAAATVTVKLDFNGTETILWKGSLSPWERVEYTDEWFEKYTSSGAVSVAQTIWSPAVNQLNIVVLSSDVTNNNATANTIQDVTGLSFSVTSWETYYFDFCIDFTTAVTTTGSRWSINTPWTTRLAYTSDWALAATTRTLGSYSTTDQPTASNATAATTDGNIARIEWFITPSASWTVIARFASEVSSSAVVAKAGSILKWMRVL